ncbi:MAG: 4Fe-4S binding protein [Eubacteriales bacterium]|nr:4Fe-4S binding protein [Eubacteriales bacterium]MDQ7790461.1 4Fe-4S binding protein [Clostridia bacterium]MDZ7610094.1 4Fe-4S binding protein [Eubacteriales bacterium]
MAIDITAGPAINRTGNCVGCGVCVEVCPQQALSMRTGRLPIPAKDPNLPA